MCSAHDGLSEATSVCVVITMMKRGRRYRERLTISGHFVVSEGMTVIARDGRTATADLTGSMLSPETLARAILFSIA